MKKISVLRNENDFLRLRKKGTSIYGKYFILVFLNNNLTYNRKAFLASKKVGNSIQRHRAVRLLRESFRLIEKENNFPNGYDFLLIAKSSINNLKCTDVKKDIEAVIKNKVIL